MLDFLEKNKMNIQVAAAENNGADWCKRNIDFSFPKL